jgi:hypothetical protein
MRPLACFLAAMLTAGCIPPENEEIGNARDAPELAEPPPRAGTGTEVSEPENMQRPGVEVPPGPVPPHTGLSGPVPGPRLPPTPTPEAPEVPQPDPKAQAHQLVLAGIARTVVDAMRDDDLAAFSALTPRVDGPVRTACPDHVGPPELEFKSRVHHCHRTIPWEVVRDVRVGLVDEDGGPASGCGPDVTALGRTRLVIVTSKGDYELDLLDTFGREGETLGFGGAVACRAK